MLFIQFQILKCSLYDSPTWHMFVYIAMSAHYLKKKCQRGYKIWQGVAKWLDCQGVTKFDNLSWRGHMRSIKALRENLSLNLSSQSKCWSRINKVDGSSNGYFFQLVHSSKDMKHAMRTRWLANSGFQIKAIATFLIIFKAHMIIWFLFRVTVIMHIRW